MASVADCERALHELADRINARDPQSNHAGFDRTLACRLRDLGVAFTGRFENGRLLDVTTAATPRPSAQIGLEMTSDDLVALVDGRLKFGSAWATGRVTLHAGIRDMMRLRTIF